jgi:hypothetical protein
MQLAKQLATRTITNIQHYNVGTNSNVSQWLCASFKNNWHIKWGLNWKKLSTC